VKKNRLNKELIDSVLNVEKAALNKLIDMDKTSIFDAITLIHNCSGKIIGTGIGKSAFVAQKFVATLNSSGTSAVFLHAADAMHGDVGIIDKDDVVVFISKSGGSKEILELLSFVNSNSVSSIGIFNNNQSDLNQKCTVPILLPSVEEAGKDNILPTASFIAHLAICDCISIALMEMNEFTSQDFGRLHPRGTLGKQLATVETIASSHSRPYVSLDDTLQHVIYTISSHKLGACCVLDADHKVLGIITDGDIRRMLEKQGDITNLKASDIYTTSPKTVDHKVVSKEALHIMGQYNINQLIVIDSENNYLGMIHLQDLINE